MTWDPLGPDVRFIGEEQINEALARIEEIGHAIILGQTADGEWLHIVLCKCGWCSPIIMGRDYEASRKTWEAHLTTDEHKGSLDG